MQSLNDKLSKKMNSVTKGQRVGPGWLKYQHGESFWNLDDGTYWIFLEYILRSRFVRLESFNSNLVVLDLSGGNSDSDYAIFVWRHAAPAPNEPPPPIVLHLQDPNTPLPTPPDYQNPSFYAFSTRVALTAPYSGNAGGAKSIRSTKSKKSGKSMRSGKGDIPEAGDSNGSGPPKFVVDFHRFHSENGVRTVKGSIGPVKDGA